jgi:Fic family protein
MDIRVPYTAHLVGLVAEASTAAGRLLDLPLEQREPLMQRSRHDAARLSARLDGSPLDDETVARVDAGGWSAPAELVEVERVGGWAGALRLEGMATHEVAAVEYANLLAAYDEEPRLAEEFFDAPLAVLAELHGIICRGLVDPAVIGRPRVTAQAVHDGAQGMVVFNTPDPEAVGPLLRDLEAWLRGETQEGSAAFPAPVAAAVVHELILQWQPFEAANGRLARAASRLVLRARGMDPFGLAVPEDQWVRDAGGYYGEVAATIRRRGDLGPWTERATEALVQALALVVARAHPAAGAAPHPRALAAAAALPSGATITVGDYAQQQGLSRETAWRDLRALVVWGEVVREPRNLGRRFRRA